jgi:hypothetical protein
LKLRKLDRDTELLPRFRGASFGTRQPLAARIGVPLKSRRSDSSTKGEADVGFKGIIAATASVALMAAPTMAAAQTSAVATTEVAPGDENVSGSELRGGFIIPLIALIAIILGLCVATDICGRDDDELPTSP